MNRKLIIGVIIMVLLFVGLLVVPAMAGSHISADEVIGHS